MAELPKKKKSIIGHYSKMEKKFFPLALKGAKNFSHGSKNIFEKNV